MSVLPAGELAGVPIEADEVLAGHSARDRLRREEIAIARAFHRPGGWAYVAVALGGSALWVATLGLALAGRMPLGVAFVISTVFCSVSYVPAHEAIHDNVFPRGSRWHWLNELCGWAPLVPLVLPLSLARVLHRRHHSHVNHPEYDPDFIDHAPDLWRAIVKSVVNRAPSGGWREAYRRCCEQVGTREALGAMRLGLAWGVLYIAVLAAMAWTGHAMVAALVWWLPRHIGLTYGRVYLSWMPHHPRAGHTGRYDSTRVFRSIWGDIGSVYMGYHLVHHLYPRIPVHRTRPAFHAMRDILVARGVDCTAKPARVVR